MPQLRAPVPLSSHFPGQEPPRVLHPRPAPVQPGTATSRLGCAGGWQAAPQGTRTTGSVGVTRVVPLGTHPWGQGHCGAPTRGRPSPWGGAGAAPVGLGHAAHMGPGRSVPMGVSVGWDTPRPGGARGAEGCCARGAGGAVSVGRDTPRPGDRGSGQRLKVSLVAGQWRRVRATAAPGPGAASGPAPAAGGQ